MAKRLLAFDMDGTLTQHKSKLEEMNLLALKALSEKYKLLMIGAGNCERIYHQLNDFPIEIIGNYGLQHSAIVNGEFKILESLTVPVDRDFVERTVTMLRKEFGFEKFYGDNVEFHASGAITFPVLGTAAPLAEKLAYDPDRLKRRKVYARVCEAFAGYNVFIGGSSSFDITRGEYNKYYALERFCRENGYTVDCVEITDYRTFAERSKFLLD